MYRWRGFPVCCVIHRGMVDDTNQIRKCSNLHCVSWYTDGEIFRFTVVSFLVLSVFVCAWSMTPKLCGRPASVGFAQARPNKTIYETALTRNQLAD